MTEHVVRLLERFIYFLNFVQEVFSLPNHVCMGPVSLEKLFYSNLSHRLELCRSSQNICNLSKTKILSAVHFGHFDENDCVFERRRLQTFDYSIFCNLGQ